MILCCGEALIDMIPTPTIGGQDGFVPHSGGAVFNTAISLGRLGVRTGMLTGVSTDIFGQQLESSLEASHVDASLSIRTDRPSTLAFVKLTDRHASYSFFDENSAGRMIKFTEIPELPDEISTLFFGGISLAAEPGAQAYAKLCGLEGNDRLVMIDPNVRPGFIENEEIYRERLKAMIGKADIVKVSDEDLNWLIQGPLSLKQKIDCVLEQGPKIVLMTRGGDGAFAFCANGSEISVASEPVTVADTVGAGDTFNGGFLAKISELGYLSKDYIAEIPKEKLKHALAYGAKVAAKTVSREGANPPWADEL